MWTKIVAALHEASARDRLPQFWWRDDDVGLRTDRLASLVQIAIRLRVPISFAAIPSRTSQETVALLREAPAATILQHGFNHTSRSTDPFYRTELAENVGYEALGRLLQRGATRLAALAGSAFLPVMVPPWNCIQPTVTRWLHRYGYTGLSTFGPKDVQLDGTEFTNVNVHIDPIDWSTRRLRPHSAIATDFCAAIQLASRTGEPIGLVTHHAHLDASALDAFRALVCITRESGAEWVPASRLFPVVDRIPLDAPFRPQQSTSQTSQNDGFQSNQ